MWQAQYLAVVMLQELQNDPVDYDVLIAGAGPGGCATAISLAGSGLRVGILEKSTFPRDKVCGDALSPDVLQQLARLNGNLHDVFLETHAHTKLTVHGVRVFAANGRSADLNLNLGRSDLTGWVAKRVDFDNFLFEQTCKQPHVTMLTGCPLRDVEVLDNKVVAHTADGAKTARIIIGADGAHSLIAKRLAGQAMDRHHHCAAVRAYFTNVKDFHPDGMIELHFYKRLLPGYFWIFPLPNNEANVGLGMLSSYISDHKVNLKDLIHDVIRHEPALAERFADARMEGEIKGFGLPLGSRKRTLSGERFILVGDAASLIDPVTGEGIGNAIRSGRFAAEQVRKCFETSDFSAEFMHKYDVHLYSLVWGEMRFSRTLQRAFRYPFIINSLIGFANSSRRFRNFLNLAVMDAEFWADGLNPVRWVKHWRGAGRY